MDKFTAHLIAGRLRKVLKSGQELCDDESLIGDEYRVAQALRAEAANNYYDHLARYPEFFQTKVE